MEFGVNLGGVVPASGVAPLPEIPGGKIRFLGHGHFSVTLDVIAQTGADVTTLLNIPFSHELTTITVKHTDANKADSTDAQTVTFNHRYDNLWFNVWKINAGTASDTYGKFTDMFKLPGQYLIVSNTTNLHLLHITFELYVMQV